MTPRIPSEDPVTRPASPEMVFDELKLTRMRLGSDRLIISLVRVTAEDVVDETHEGLDIVFRDFEAQLIRAPVLATVWNNMLRALAALYRERRLVEKIEDLTAIGGYTSVLEKRLAAVRDQLVVN